MLRGASAVLVLTLLVPAAGCASTRSGPAPVTTTSDEARSDYAAGLNLADLHRHADAEEAYRRAVESDPGFAMAWLRLAGVTGSVEGSEECLARAREAGDSATQAERLAIDASVAEHRGRLGEAQEIRKALVRRYPEDARLRYELGLSYWSTDPAEAAARIEEAVELDPALHVAWNMLGYVYASLDRKEDAVRAHRRYVEILPDEPNAHDSLAESLMKAGRFAESIEEYERALALDPSFAWSRVGIGHNLVFLGRYDEARAAYRAALDAATTPRDRYQAVDWLMVLGVYSGDRESALRDADAAVEVAAEIGAVEEAWAIRNKARIQLFAGRPDAAERTAKGVLSTLGPETGEASREDLLQATLRLRVETLLAAGDRAGARSTLEEIRSRTESTGNVWQKQLLAFTEGYLLLSEGDAIGAAESLGRTSRTDPRALFHLAEARAGMGHEEEARALYRRVAEWNSPSLSHALVHERAKRRLREQATPRPTSTASPTGGRGAARGSAR